MVFCVGLTGSIASGKTVIAQMFAALGVQIIYADKISAEIATQPEVIAQISARFGERVLLADGSLNRRMMRELIFSQAEERFWLERLLHPLIRLRIEELVNQCSSPYCMVEIPLLIDKNYYPYINRILLVTAEPQEQLARIMKRDQCTKEQAEAIVHAQPELQTRMQHADDLLLNDQDLSTLNEDVIKLHLYYLSLLGKNS